MPLTSKEDVDFFTHLEMYIRTEGLSLIGRDHLSYRCAFAPVKVCLIALFLRVRSVLLCFCAVCCVLFFLLLCVRGGGGVCHLACVLPAL